MSKEQVSNSTVTIMNGNITITDEELNNFAQMLLVSVKPKATMTTSILIPNSNVLRIILNGLRDPIQEVSSTNGEFSKIIFKNIFAQFMALFCSIRIKFCSIN